MSLTESIVEDAALTMPAATLTRPLPWGEEWELGYSCLGAEALTPALCLRPSPLRSGSHGERESYGEVVQSRAARTLIPTFSHREKEARKALRRLSPAILQSRTLATLRDTLLPKLLSGELSVAEFTDTVEVKA